MTAAAAKTKQLSFTQLEDLWVQAGGDQKLAATMAAVALAESRGNPLALNNTPSTGDFSVGLWQINYYGSLGPARTKRYGPVSGQYDPLTNATTAVALAAGGAGLANWSTWKDGAFIAYVPKGTQVLIPATGGGSYWTGGAGGTQPGPTGGGQPSTGVGKAVNNAVGSSVDWATGWLGDAERWLAQEGKLVLAYVVLVAVAGALFVTGLKGLGVRTPKLPAGMPPIPIPE